MAERYVRSTDGADSDDGSTWGLAKATASGVAAIDTAGDTIYFSQSHSESTAAALTLAWAGTLASPTKLVCGNDAAEPPTSPETTATIATTGASSITLTGGAIYSEGINYSCGSAANSASFFYTVDGGLLHLKNGSIALNNSNSAPRIFFGLGGANNDTKIVLDNVGLKFGASGQYITPSNVQLEILGGSLLSGGVSPSVLFYVGGGGSNALITGWDLSNIATSTALFTAGLGTVGKFIMRGIKFPEGWTGPMFSGGGAPGSPSFRVELHNYTIGTARYQLWAGDYQGSVKSETTVVRSGGSSENGVAYSLKMTSSANAEYPMLPLETPPLKPVWISDTGSAKTVTIPIVHDSVTNLTNADIGIDLYFLGTSGSSQLSKVSSIKASYLEDASDLAASSETWTTTGLTNPNKQQMSVTFTPQETGYYVAVAKLFKASKTVFVCNKPVVS